MTNSVCNIRPDNFVQEVMSETRPVLLLCMPQDESFPAQKKIIDDISVIYARDIKIGLIEETYIDAFKRNLNIHGTPTYLLMVHGKEKNRLIGLTDRETLEAFIFSS